MRTHREANRITRRILPLLLTLLLCSVQTCSPPAGRMDGIRERDPVIRVCVDATPADTRVRIITKATLIAGTVRRSLDPNQVLTCGRSDRGVTISIDGTPLLPAARDARILGFGTDPVVSFRNRLYSDTLLLTAQDGKLYFINILPVERYLLDVVPNEMGRDRQQGDIEALKAQAIVARTYAYRKIVNPMRRLFDVFDDVRDQVFTGSTHPKALTLRAVRETRGSVLLYVGSPAEVYFHSACGGRTEAPQIVWSRPRAISYLNGVEDGEAGSTYCSIAPSYRWETTFTRAELEASIRKYIALANRDYAQATIPRDYYLLDLRITRRSPSGRVSGLIAVLGNRREQKQFFVEGDRIRWILRRPEDESVLRSTLIDLRVTRDRNRWITDVTLNGRGLGHGVGMCQWGAIGMSRSGHDATGILQHYFPGTTTGILY